MRYPVYMLLLLLAALAGCSKKIETAADYRQWINDPANGFTRERYVNNLRIEGQFRSMDLMTLNELKGYNNVTTHLVDSLRSTYKGSLYFMLSVGYDDRKQDNTAKGFGTADWLSYDSYAEKVKTLSFDMGDMVFLVRGSDTIYPSLYHHEMGYELASRESFLFAFPDAGGDDNVKLVYNDDLFNTGITQFEFNTDSKKLPEISHLVQY